MKSINFTTQIEKILYNENDAGESFSSVSLNPTFAWIKFVLTDDQPNENKQRIPKDEFANLVRTGIFAPVKMGTGEIKEDHSDALPLGVITHLKEVDNKVEGMAALWSREREQDITMLKQMYADGNLPQLSWEMLFADSTVDETGVEDLHGTALRATTIVGMPAYAGRTPIYAMASKKNSNSEETNVEELEQLKASIKELEDKLAAKEAELSAKQTEFASFSTELEELRQYKQTVESEREAATKLESIKNKFKSAGIEKPEEYFAEKKDLLLRLEDATLDYMIQEMVSFASNKKESKSSTEDVKVPDIKSDAKEIEKDPKKLAEALRQRNLKK